MSWHGEGRPPLIYRRPLATLVVAWAVAWAVYAIFDLTSVPIGDRIAMLVHAAGLIIGGGALTVLLRRVTSQGEAE